MTRAPGGGDTLRHAAAGMRAGESGAVGGRRFSTMEKEKTKQRRRGAGGRARPDGRGLDDFPMGDTDFFESDGALLGGGGLDPLALGVYLRLLCRIYRGETGYACAWGEREAALLAARMPEQPGAQRVGAGRRGVRAGVGCLTRSCCGAGCSPAGTSSGAIFPPWASGCSGARAATGRSA